MAIRILATAILAAALLGCGRSTEPSTNTSADAVGDGTTTGAKNPAAPASPNNTGATAIAGGFAAMREFRFVYGGAITGLEPGAKARVWLPVAASGPDQQVTRESVALPVEFQETKDGRHGNPLIYFEAEADDAGEIPFEVVYRVGRSESLLGAGPMASEAGQAKFLGSSALVPVDGSVLTAMVSGGRDSLAEDSLEVGRQLYQAVDKHMRYDKPEGNGWGRGDARWACQAGYGNCTDFHSLFIAACRDLGIAAKFEIGFPIPNGAAGEIGGYHCWAKFVGDGRWTGVDISEADKDPRLAEYCFGNLSPDRVLLTTGRDLVLEPQSAGGPVNFLVYPYVEVAGKPHENFRKDFRWEAIEEE